MCARYMRAVLVASVAAALSLAAAPGAFAAAIPVSSVTASSTFYTYDANNLVNDSGLAGGLHDGVWQHKWLSDGWTPTATLLFDLGSVQSVAEAHVWNYGPGCCGNERSVKDLTVLASLDGVAFTTLGSFVLSLPRGDVDPFPGEVLSLGTHARYIKLSLLSNYGDPDFIGLSEVKFDDGVTKRDTNVPEPAALLLLGTSLAGLWRARRSRL